MSELKDRIRKIRKEAGFTQAKFGEEIGASGQAITFYENGYRTPTGPTISMICERFKINKEWLLKGEGEMHRNGLPRISHEREMAIAKIVGKLYTDNDDYRTRLIEGLAELTDDELLLVRDLIRRLADREKE